ncbi:MAG TPA: basic secretory protein-like protein, partial [Verrucomicrobiota bacterium]|nr:basic secretory protein-like protein [Verrucomicrobiota bacterium]
DSYKTTAIFLEWAEKKYDKELVKKLNKPLREGKFKIDMFKDITGKTVDELWAEFTDSLRSKSPGQQK